jgi:hypothetical protein
MPSKVDEREGDRKQMNHHQMRQAITCQLLTGEYRDPLLANDLRDLIDQQIASGA